MLPQAAERVLQALSESLRTEEPEQPGSVKSESWRLLASAKWREPESSECFDPADRWWGPALWQPVPSCRVRYFIQVSEYLVDHCRVFDIGDDADITSAFAAGFDSDREHALQSLCPGHGCPALGGRLVWSFQVRFGFPGGASLGATPAAAQTPLFAGNHCFLRFATRFKELIGIFRVAAH